MTKKTKTSKKSSPNKKDFIVVGLGASAGGVKAIQEFFATMPPNSGMAFVVILHLSPEHESNLREIVQAQTAMSVTLVSEAHRVEPNRVYVIPPNKNLEMVDGIIRCTDLKAERGTRVAIDLFFRTLADEYEKNAVCVVLSGTGTDGTLGLKAVKEANGFAVVQDPADAEYDSMPRSAIATGLVDWVLPVRKMPEKLIQFRDSSERLHLTRDDDHKIAKEIQADDSLREILTVLRVRTGHDFSNYKMPTLVRRIARHLQIYDLEDIPAYLEFLRTKPNEIQSLLKNLLINVTNFFRDKEAWEALEAKVVPNLFAGKKGGDTVRVWSCGCASGEEAFSLAMILTEYAARLKDPPKIQVFATDVDEDAIAEAREHRYPQSIEADVSPERLKQFFLKEGKYYRVKKELRETVLFAPHNVLRDPPFSKLDLIACRNLLIYLNRETQERVMEIFHFALAANGYIFLGSSESADGTPNLFTTVDKKCRIYSRRPAPVAQPNIPPRMPVSGRWEIKMPILKGKRPENAFSLGEVHYKLLEQLAPPSVLVNHDFDVQYMSEAAGRYLRFKGGEPSSNLLKLINPDLLPDLRAALFTVQHDRKMAHFPHIRVRLGSEEASVSIIVRAVEIENETSDYLLVVFDENKNFVLTEDEKQRREKNQTREKGEAMEAVVLQLEGDLARTKDNLRTTIEQHEISIEELKASNEELQAINEELRSTTEELETSKEELQSVNEELTTVNQELKEKIDETTRVNSDLQNLMASTDIATIFLDRSLKIKRFTPPIERLFNITAVDIGRPLEHFTHHLDYKDLAKDAGEVLRTLKPFEREVSDKDKRTYLTRFVPYRTVEDHIEGVVLNFLDITERKQTEEAWRASEERLQKALSIPTVGVLFLDSEGVIHDSNEAFEQMSGYSREHFHSGKVRWDDLTPPEFKAVTLKSWEELLKSGQITPYEKQFLRHDGTRRWGLFAGKRLSETEFVKFVIDISERKLAQEAKFFLASIVESSEDSMVTVNFEGTITSWNKAAENLYGYPAHETIGKPLTMLTLPEDLKKVLSNIEKIKQNKKVEIYDTVRVHKGGSEMNLEIVLSPVKDEQGQVIGVSTIARDVTDRRLAEEALRQSEEQFRTFLDTISDVVYRMSADWHEMRSLAGKEFIVTTKHPRQDWMDEYIIKEDRKMVWEAIEKAIKTKSVFELEHRVIRLDGTIGWTFSRAVPILNSQGEIVEWFGAATDISNRKFAEEALRESEAHLAAVFAEAKVGISEISTGGRFLRVNDALCRILGRSRDELLTLTFTDVTFPEDVPPSLEAVGRLLETGEPVSIDRRYLRQNGEIVWANSSLSLLRGDGKEPVILGVTADLTERKMAEEALRKSEEHLQLILESTKDYAIITFDLEGRITRWNKGAEKIFGWTDKEAVGQTTHLLFTHEDRAANVPEKELAKALKDGRAEDERWHLRKDGSRFFASGVMQLLRNGETEGFVKIARDQTERLKAETAQKDRQMLAQLVSTQEDERRRIARDLHDHLGQQLTSLRLKLESLKKQENGETVKKEVGEAQKIAEQIDRDVDFLAWELRPASLDDLGLRATVGNFVAEWSRYTGIKADFHAAGLTRQRLDFEIETNLYRIGQEALNNIFKHAEAKNVSVLLEKRGDKVLLIIEDDGKGFDVVEKKNRGSGLGLTGMNERAKLCGGNLEIESAKGKGTAIFVRVPAKKKHN